MFCWFVGTQHCFADSLAYSTVLLVRWHIALFCWFGGVGSGFAGSLAYSSITGSFTCSSVLLFRWHTAVFCRFGGISKVLLGIGVTWRCACDVTWCYAYAVEVAVERWDSVACSARRRRQAGVR